MGIFLLSGDDVIREREGERDRTHESLLHKMNESVLRNPFTLNGYWNNESCKRVVD